jgi:hypothetical protein
MNLFLKELEGSVSIFMKERKWTTYKDKETNIPVNIEQVESRVVDQKMLQVLLNEEQISRVVRKKKEEKISILTKDKIERLKKYGKR